MPRETLELGGMHKLSYVIVVFLFDLVDSTRSEFSRSLFQQINETIVNQRV